MTASMREAFVAAASDLLDEHERLAVVLADISVDLFAAAARRHPSRVINVGIREQLMISVAAGLALSGLRPIVHTYTPFLIERPFEQVKLDLGHQGVGAVLVSTGASYDAAGSGRTHQAPEDVAVLAALPGWTIQVPGHPDEAQRLVRDAAAVHGRVYIRLSAAANAAPMPTGNGFATVRRGSGATVVAVGPMLDRVLAATAHLDVTVLYAVTVRPFDAVTLRTSVRTPEVVLVEPYLAGTSAACISQALESVPHRLLSIGVPAGEFRRYGSAADHDTAHGLDAPGIRARIEAFLERAVPQDPVSTASAPP
jgi:transketolase